MNKEKEDETLESIKAKIAKLEREVIKLTDQIHGLRVQNEIVVSQLPHEVLAYLQSKRMQNNKQDKV